MLEGATLCWICGRVFLFRLPIEKKRLRTLNAIAREVNEWRRDGRRLGGNFNLCLSPIGKQRVKYYCTCQTSALRKSSENSKALSSFAFRVGSLRIEMSRLFETENDVSILKSEVMTE